MARIDAHIPTAPPVHGGTVMAEAAVTLLSHQHQVHVRPLPGARDAADLGRLRIGKVVKLVGWALKTLSAEPPDLAYIVPAMAGLGRWRDTMLCVWLRWRGVKRLIHLHGDAPAGHRMRWMLAGANVVTLSPKLAEKWRPCANRVFVVRNAARETQAQETSGPLRLVYLSTLKRSKGIDTFMATLTQLRAQDVSFRANIAGAMGPDWRPKTPLPPNTVLHGEIDPDTRDGLLSAADILLFPSRHPPEAQPLVLLEAMAAETVPIAPPIGAIPEMLSAGGGLIIPPDPDQLAIAIAALAADRARLADLKRRAKETWRGAYQWQHFETALTDAVDRSLSPLRRC